MGTLAATSAMVTGGCGFIGSHLVRRLLAEGVRRVVVLDSLRHGSERNLEGLGDAGAVSLVRFALGSDAPALLDRHLEGVDHLFHLAAEKHNQSRHEPDAILRSNVLGSHALFAAARRRGVKKVVFASSLYSYGRLAGAPFRETDPARPATVYGISKLCGELLLAEATAGDAMRGDVLRYFFAYGPRQLGRSGYPSVIVRNFERMRAGQAPVIHGDGSQRLDYVYVEDVVEATLRCMESPGSGRVLNVGSGSGTSIEALTATMLRVAGSNARPLHEPPDWTHGTSRVADIEAIRTALGWQPRVGLERGLQETWKALCGEERA